MTSMHEHVFIDFVCMYSPPEEAHAADQLAESKVGLENLGWVRYDPFRNKDNLELLDEQMAIYEIGLFKSAGGATIVDATTIGMGRNPQALVNVANATGVNIVMGAGHYVDMVHPGDMDDRSEEQLASQMIEEVTVGVDGTTVRAGIIGELGCSWPLTKNESKVLRASASAQRETGAAILIHPGRNPRAPFEILDVSGRSRSGQRPGDYVTPWTGPYWTPTRCWSSPIEVPCLSTTSLAGSLPTTPLRPMT